MVLSWDCRHASTCMQGPTADAAVGGDVATCFVTSCVIAAPLYAPVVCVCVFVLVQIMSTEDVQDQHCAGFDAAMDCVQALLHDELQAEPVGTVRLILPHGQVGAVMGKKGATIK